MGQLLDAVNVAEQALRSAQNAAYERRTELRQAMTRWEQANKRASKNTDALYAELDTAQAAAEEAGKAEDLARAQLQGVAAKLMEELRPRRARRESYVRRLLGLNPTSDFDIRLDWGRDCVFAKVYLFTRNGAEVEPRFGFDLSITGPQHRYGSDEWEEAEVQTASIGALGAADLRDYLRLYGYALILAETFNHMCADWRAEDTAD